MRAKITISTPSRENSLGAWLPNEQVHLARRFGASNLARHFGKFVKKLLKNHFTGTALRQVQLNLLKSRSQDVRCLSRFGLDTQFASPSSVEYGCVLEGSTWTAPGWLKARPVRSEDRTRGALPAAVSCRAIASGTRRSGRGIRCD
jgi:hypothetical protein